MARFQNSPKNEFKKAKGDLISYGENKLTDGNADLFKAGYHTGKGIYEEVQERINSYKRKDGTKVKAHTKRVHRKISPNNRTRRIHK